MNILITGNNGYIGPILYRELKKKSFFVHGLDTNYYTNKNYSDYQHNVDIRSAKKIIFKNIDVVIHLASLSNDPLGKQFNTPTEQINVKASKKIIDFAKSSGCKIFLFASSCSVYGKNEKNDRNEKDKTNPLTAYAKSKVLIEKYLKKKSSKNFRSICMRFATACGASPNLRLDLVLNDFISSAVTHNKIILNSSGNAWRPLIDVKDMSRAIIYFMENFEKMKNYNEVFNVGVNLSNIKIIELAKKVKNKIKNTKIEIVNFEDDKRSYRVNFSKYQKLIKKKYSHLSLERSIENLIKNIKLLKINKKNKINFNRLNVLQKLIVKKKLNANLRWNF